MKERSMPDEIREKLEVVAEWYRVPVEEAHRRMTEMMALPLSEILHVVKQPEKLDVKMPFPTQLPLPPVWMWDDGRWRVMTQLEREWAETRWAFGNGSRLSAPPNIAFDPTRSSLR